MFLELKKYSKVLTVAVPMVASFLGCTFGGFLYDVFIYTGPESPINTPWLGLKRLTQPHSVIRQKENPTV